MSRLTRVITALLLVTVAVVHLNLYSREYYDKIPTVGWLFLLTVISGFLLAVVQLMRTTWLIELSIIGFAAGVLGGYLLTLLLPMGLFNFHEPGVSYSGAISIAAEVGVILLAGTSAIRSLKGKRAKTPSQQPIGG
jgi:hypothetical protein